MRTRRQNPLARLGDLVFVGITTALVFGYATCLYSLARVV